MLILIILLVIIICYLLIYSKKEFINKITNNIEKGDGYISRIYGYPTANIENIINLECGTYTANSNYGDCACLVINPKKIECHIKNFKGDLYGKKLKLYNIKRTYDDLDSALSLYCDYNSQKIRII